MKKLSLFTKTRIKLTSWYVLIIMLVSLAFSIIIFQEINLETERALRMQQYRLERRIFPPVDVSPYYDDVLSEARDRLIIILAVINMGILTCSAVAGYFLAGKTLRPIEEMMEEQKRFVSDASHELRTPLTAIKTEVEVALRDKKLSLLEAKRLLRSNLEEVSHMEALSNYLLSLNKYQQNQADLPKKQVDLSTIAQEAIKQVSHLVKEKRLTLNQNLESVSVMGNQESLKELFVIILDNAIKYSADRQSIDISVQRIDSHCQIKISDQGIGIKKEDLPKIFDRFYRSDFSRNKTNVSGYGLGLSIASQIVSLHNGSIKVESVENKGSTFMVNLPISKDSLRIDV